MTPRARARLISVIIVIFGLGLAASLMLYGLSDKITYFHTPSDIAALTDQQTARTIRIGGLVKAGSVQHEGENYRFTISDNAAELNVAYRGIMPDLFREGQSVIAYGKYDRTSQTFHAEEILAKHDENYMPPDVKKALEKQ